MDDDGEFALNLEAPPTLLTVSVESAPLRRRSLVLPAAAASPAAQPDNTVASASEAAVVPVVPRAESRRHHGTSGGARVPTPAVYPMATKLATSTQLKTPSAAPTNVTVQAQLRTKDPNSEPIDVDRSDAIGSGSALDKGPDIMAARVISESLEHGSAVVARHHDATRTPPASGTPAAHISSSSLLASAPARAVHTDVHAADPAVAAFARRSTSGGTLKRARVRDAQSAAAVATASADTFDALGLDARLVSKVCADVHGSHSHAAAARAAALQQPRGTGVGDAPAAGAVASTSAVSGIARGHLRDGFGLSRPTRVQRLVIPAALAGESVLARSETGSGKTLAFLLPIAHALLRAVGEAVGTAGGAEWAAAAALEGGGGAGPRAPRAALGTLAIILAPTRELCQQIYGVAARLLQPFPTIVPGIVAGGEKRKSEKARLRRGCALLVATPGRLLDHLRTTEAFDASRLAFLVLDEADRLLDLGFGGQVADIVAALRAQAARAATSGGRSSSASSWQTFLLSATLSPSVRELARAVLRPGETAQLVDAALSSAVDEPDVDDDEDGADAGGEAADSGNNTSNTAATTTSQAPATPPPATDVLSLTAPAQLTQAYSIVALKWRLVTLLAAVVDAAVRASKARRAVAAAAADASGADRPAATVGAKIIVFLSTTDAVDLHFHLFSALLPYMLPQGMLQRHGASSSVTAFSLHRLHGAMPQSVRTASFRAFAAAGSGLLLATDVAARGLDLPSVDAIIQADAPSDTLDYVHRVGRTGRRGEAGRALLLLQPHEAPYAALLGAAGLALAQEDAAPMLAALSRTTVPISMLEHLMTAHNGDAQKPAGSADATTPAAARDIGAADNADGSRGAAASIARIHGLVEAAERAGRGSGKSEGGAASAGSSMARRGEMHAVLWQAIAEEVVAHTGSLPSGAGALSGITLRVPQAATPAASQEHSDDRATASLTATTPVAAKSSSSSVLTLADLARAAFTSFVRAYATHDRSVRHIFHPRALHLGHAAKAFGLREPPTSVVSRDKKRSQWQDAAATAGAAVSAKRQRTDGGDAYVNAASAGDGRAQSGQSRRARSSTGALHWGGGGGSDGTAGPAASHASPPAAMHGRPPASAAGASAAAHISSKGSTGSSALPAAPRVSQSVSHRVRHAAPEFAGQRPAVGASSAGGGGGAVAAGATDSAAAATRQRRAQLHGAARAAQKKAAVSEFAA